MACTSHTNTTTCTHTNTTTCTHTNTTPCSAHANTTACAAHTVAACSHTNSCPAHVGYIGPVTPTNWTNDPLSNTKVIKVIDYNELRSAIDAELTRRSVVATLPAVNAIGDVIDRTEIAQLRNAIVEARAWAYPAVLQNAILIEGEEVLAEQFTLMQAEVNSQEAECVCNCNYACTCNCNYACTCQCNYSCTCQCNYSCTCQCNYSCTCQCNYACTCNCNYCTCNCNYACTCNCNYSDERLKTDIIFF